MRKATNKEVTALKEQNVLMDKRAKTLEDQKKEVEQMHQTNKGKITELNETIHQLQIDKQELEKEQVRVSLDQPVLTSINTKDSWNTILENFNKIHPTFCDNLKKTYPNLSPTYQKYAICAKMELRIKETAILLNVSPSTAKDARWRLKKQLGLPSDTRLKQFFQEFK